MKAIHAIATALFVATTAVAVSGCAVGRNQSTVGQYVDDSAITTQVKAKFAESPDVAATSIKVKTLNGVVQLSGFAKNSTEKSRAATLAASVEHVKRVENDIIVSP
ncbi:MAG: BON domain-containing protein [Sulfuriferula multivorans]|uniref:BON domain-containing protein n=1 Tax=Sulfuriferula multivorans TaxID=1559896 RepID=A0A7C9NQJ9_9PROT|nr:BON domain-containing protein [Sulfuriferula multivorans]